MVPGQRERTVLGYPKLKAHMESRNSPSREKEKALQYLKEIQSELSLPHLRSVSKFLGMAFPKLYDGINFDDSMVQIPELRKNHHVILVPNHQSHADYLAINHMFFKTYQVPLYVAGGENLNLFLVGDLFRRSGCFFIRRSFTSNMTYKLTLEAYLYFLLKNDCVIEFFFEGGRSRTGKLLPPRYGLYGMLMDAHRELYKQSEKTLLFVPISIVHEYAPETGSLVKELRGAKKRRESIAYFPRLLRLLSYQFGHIHIRLGRPVEAKPLEEGVDHIAAKDKIHHLAFQCFREVGKNMLVTPTSLLSFVLLDEPSGAMSWRDILSKSKAIVAYCRKFQIPCAPSLSENQLESSLERAMDILVGNKWVDVIGRQHQGRPYYAIRESRRREVLYNKNTILHHFLVPATVNYVWINLFSGQVQTAAELKELFLNYRRQLKHEFYLPTVKEFFQQILNVLGDTIGRRISSMEEVVSFSHRELYAIISSLGIFGRALSHIDEAYYIAGLALAALKEEYPEGFKMEAYLKTFKVIFYQELQLGRIIRYSESYSLTLAKSGLKYFTHMGPVKNEVGMLSVVQADKLEELTKKYEKNLTDQLTFNIRVSQS